VFLLVSRQQGEELLKKRRGRVPVRDRATCPAPSPSRPITHVTGAPQVAGPGEGNPVGQRRDERHKPGDQGLREESGSV